MRSPTRRTFLAANVVFGFDACAQSAPASPPAWPLDLAGIHVPESKFTRLALDALRDCSPPFLVNHAMRTFFFGALFGRVQKFSFDSELLFVACALHDLGLTSKYQGALPFEIQGAEAARQILAAAGLPAAQTQTVWDGIAMHPQRIADFKPPEISLVAAGAGLDVVGRLDKLPPSDVKAIVDAFPRLEFKKRFVETCGEIANKYPGAASRTFMRDIAERTNPAYKVSNICDAIAAAPFSE
jgi:hypothetical protein